MSEEEIYVWGATVPHISELYSVCRFKCYVFNNDIWAMSLGALFKSDALPSKVGAAVSLVKWHYS